MTIEKCKICGFEDPAGMKTHLWKSHGIREDSECIPCTEKKEIIKEEIVEEKKSKIEPEEIISSDEMKIKTEDE